MEYSGQTFRLVSSRQPPLCRSFPAAQRKPQAFSKSLLFVLVRCYWPMGFNGRNRANVCVGVHRIRHPLHLAPTHHDAKRGRQILGVGSLECGVLWTKPVRKFSVGHTTGTPLSRRRAPRCDASKSLRAPPSMEGTRQFSSGFFGHLFLCEWNVTLGPGNTPLHCSTICTGGKYRTQFDFLVYALCAPRRAVGSFLLPSL
jgi:hypothetical protein